MKRPAATVAGATATLLLLATACGGDDAEAATAACDGTVDSGTVTMFAHEGSEADAYRQAVDDFNATRGQELDLTVELTMIPEGQYTDQVNAAAASGDLPDVLDLDGPNMANLAWAGTITSLDDCISDEQRENLLPSIIEQGTYADRLWAVGSFDSGLGLFAWRSALEEVDARIPTSAADAWTAEETEQVLRDLQDAGYDHPLDTKFWYGSQGEWFSYAFAPIVWSAGGDLIDRSDYQSADGVLNSPAVVDAFTTFQRWVADGLIDADAADDNNFLAKDAPLSWVGNWMYPAYYEAAGDDLIVLPLPDFGTGSKTGMGSWAWGMTSAAEDPDAAWAVIEFLISDPVIAEITSANTAVPATLSGVGDADLYGPGGTMELFADQLAEAPNVAVPRPVTPAYPTMTQTMTAAIDDIVQGADVQQVLDGAVARIDADIEANEGYPEPGNS
ncbi:extracellular solute-binding protein [Natronosporangium hydrolyticum]|uniref:Extracellular solute-binding protein n=1 Tax=Natronosporangium hydrolyticum TaxID=2811111 RepID=A0A895YCH2_9ACTN|nr:extracellular solute-binding protein [Natronosporangium hydrolyticum]QSB13143.1 extracellular solute-binding protein [Natronosporangium hydrolyticum]